MPIDDNEPIQEEGLMFIVKSLRVTVYHFIDLLTPAEKNGDSANCITNYYKASYSK